MKRIKLFMLALVAMVGLASCEKDENGYDHSADLEGTWTCLTANYAEALVISADGSAVSTGVEDGEYWENVKGKVVVKDGKVTMTFEDNDNTQGHFDIIPGLAFSIYTDEGDRITYNYCKEDLSEEIVGMWVCSGGNNNQAKGEVVIQTYKNDGTAIFTGTALPDATGVIEPNNNGFLVNSESKYKVVGDLLIRTGKRCVALKLNYSPNGVSMGDIMTTTTYLTAGNNVVAATSSYLRVKQSLNLKGENYDYRNVHVTNVKGGGDDIEFVGNTLNFATLDGVVMDKMLKNILFNVSFPASDKISYNCFFEGESRSIEAPIAVEGNRITIMMSKNNPVYRNVDIYAFQDVDGCQLHMYMPTSSFVNFVANVSVVTMARKGKLDLADADAVAQVFNLIDNAIESINVSIVMANNTKSL